MPTNGASLKALLDTLVAYSRIDEVDVCSTSIVFGCLLRRVIDMFNCVKGGRSGRLVCDCVGGARNARHCIAVRAAITSHSGVLVDVIL